MGNYKKMKDELISISNRLKEIENYFKNEINNNMKNKRKINLLANISNELMLSRFRITDAIKFIIKLESCET